MMGDFDTVMLYFAMTVVICGFLAAFVFAMSLKHSDDAPRGGPEWGPPSEIVPEDDLET
jgi:hypothetical protein